MDLFEYKRRKTTEVKVGNVCIGGSNPIRVQSMANTDTNNIEASAQQCKRIYDAGGELVRFTAQGIKEAANLGNIKKRLVEIGCNVPLVADIHFNPNAADEAAKYVEKVRINPGNYVDSTHTNRKFDYTDEEYAAEIEKIKTRLVPFLEQCKKRDVAIRIGVNHGSLSDRILSRYGDTPEGMVESCMEFLRICVAESFTNVVISIKASNVVVMVTTVRLLAKIMSKEGMSFPIHLGVTEAGDGEDGRIKSAAGIGALLADGIGDTIRVSLSEAPENEIPVAKALANYFSSRTNDNIKNIDNKLYEALENPIQRRPISGFDRFKMPVVMSRIVPNEGLHPDIVCGEKTDNEAFFTFDNACDIRNSTAQRKYLFVDFSQVESVGDYIDEKTIIIATANGKNPVSEWRYIVSKLSVLRYDNPVILHREYTTDETSVLSHKDDLAVKAASDMGVMFIDGLADGLFIDSPLEESVSVAFGILQAVRQRTSKTEYISCPSCGRTLYDMQSVIADIKSKTSHLVGLKIGIMGCIVNGPGEMADADYGYVGAARGKVSLYKGRECVEKNVPEEEAVAKLIELIKINGDWVDC